MKFINKILFPSLITISLLSGVKAEKDNCNENKVSIYNIHKGGLLYPEKKGDNEYIGSKEAYYLHFKDWAQWANWNIIYHENNTVSFKNIKSNYCMTWYDKDNKLVQRTCDSSFDKQKFKLNLVSTGAYVIKSEYNNQCLAGSDSDDLDKAITRDCNSENEKDDTYQWALLPPLVGE